MKLPNNRRLFFISTKTKVKFTDFECNLTFYGCCIILLEIAFSVLSIVDGAKGQRKTALMGRAVENIELFKCEFVYLFFFVFGFGS